MNSLFLAMIAAALGLSACHAGTEGTLSKSVAQAGEVRGVRDGGTSLAVGQTLLIELPNNATTGYAWRLSGSENALLRPASPFGQAVVQPHEPGMVGVGGTTAWRFTARQPGMTTLSFTYARSWERDTPPAETATYRITVR